VRGLRLIALLGALVSTLAFGDDGGVVTVEPEALPDGGAPPDAPMTVEAFEPVPAMAIEAFEPVAPGDAGAVVPSLETFAPTARAPTARVYGFLWGYGAVDTRFDSPRGAPLAENVAEARLRAVLGVDVKLTEALRVVLEGRAQVRGATQRDFDRLKGFFEPMLGDAYLDVYTSRVDVRVGNQRVALGANAALAPADSLNPRDLREGLLVAELDETLLPVFAVRAQGEVAGFSWLAAYVPFFTPHRYFVFGQDESLLQPGLGPAFDNRRVDPSIEDFVQDRLLETARPPPFAGDVALRVARPGRVRLGVSWVWMNEKLPRVRVDPELNAVLSAQAAGRPVDPAATASVLNRFQAGETLYRGTYARTHLFSLEASALLGPGQLDVDVTYSPRQTFFDADFQPIDKAAVTWVVGYSQASDSPVKFALTYLGMAIPDVGAREQLILLEPATAVGGARTGVFHLFLGSVGGEVWRKRLELSLRAAFEPIQRSFALSPRVTYLGIEGLQLFLAAELYEGPAWSPLGYYGRNDRVLVGARYDAW
jgi:hypothetical protein